MRLQVGDHAAGADLLRDLLALNPAHTDGWYSLGRAFQALGDVEAACRALERCTALDPARTDAWIALAAAYRARGDNDPAVAAYRAVLRQEPRHAAARSNLGALLCQRGHTREGLAHLRQAVASEATPAALSNLAMAEASHGDVTEAARQFEAALALSPGLPDAVVGQALLAERQGDAAAARALLAPLLESDRPPPAAVIAFARVARPEDRARARQAVAEALAGPGLEAYSRRQRHFAMGDLCDATGAYDEAFAAYAAGNALAAQRYDRTAAEGLLERSVAYFGPGGAARRPSTATPTVVFVVGMPRSGTTLVEQILDTHPDASGAGELPDIELIVADLSTGDGPYPDCLADLSAAAIEALADRYRAALEERAGDRAARVRVDKMPANVWHLGLIARLLPDARVIHCVRDARDTCLSCYFQNFLTGNAFANDLDDLAHHYRAYRAMMDHWRRAAPLPIHDVVYEDLVAEPEPQIRGLLDFCGLPWDPACLDFHRNRRSVLTASAGQVHRPLYASSVARHRHYAAHLGPLAALEP